MSRPQTSTSQRLAIEITGLLGASRRDDEGLRWRTPKGESLSCTWDEAGSTVWLDEGADTGLRLIAQIRSPDAVPSALAAVRESLRTPSRAYLDRVIAPLEGR